MNWYVARILTRSVSTLSKGEVINGGEESFRLVRAKDIKEARKRAVMMGKKLQYKTKDYKGRPLREEFVEVLDVCRVEDGLKDGNEIYSLLLVPREIRKVQSFFDLGQGKKWIRPE
jgi:hypothetical protein